MKKTMVLVIVIGLVCCSIAYSQMSQITKYESYDNGDFKLVNSRFRVTTNMGLRKSTIIMYFGDSQFTVSELISARESLDALIQLKNSYKKIGHSITYRCLLNSSGLSIEMYLNDDDSNSISIYFKDRRIIYMGTNELVDFNKFLEDSLSFINMNLIE